MSVQVGNPSFLYEEMLDDYDDTNADPELKISQEAKVFTWEKSQSSSLPQFLWHEASRSISSPPRPYGILVHCRVTPSICRYPFIRLGRETHCEIVTRTQRDVPRQGPVSWKPRKLFGSAKLKPFLVHLYLRVEECKRLKSLFILRLSGVDWTNHWHGGASVFCLQCVKGAFWEPPEPAIRAFR